MIRIKKVLNSSVVLVDKEGSEMVVLGKGIGFGKKAGEIIEESHVDQIFLPENKRIAHILELIEEIPFIYFDMTKKIILMAQKRLNKTLTSNLYLTLTDHIHFAVERAQSGQIVANKLYWEIKHYYPEEYEIGLLAITQINDAFQVDLPKEEASNIAFHLINAQSESESADSFRYAKMISSLVNMVKYSVNFDIETTSIHYTRFITHIRFFVERFYSDQLIEDTDDELYHQMLMLYPHAMELAIKLNEYIQKMYGKTIPNEEVVYLAVHINRLMKHSNI